MRNVLSAVATLAGLGLVVLGVAIALLLGPGRSESLGTGLVAVLFVLFAFAVVAWKVWGSLDVDSGRPVPWAPDEPFASPAPERSREEFPLSSDHFARRTAEAGDAARSEGTVADGIAVVRPELRETLVAVLVAGSHDEASARRAVETGEWTDDPVAAAVLDPGLPGRERSIRERVEAWLFPERVVRERVRRAVQAIADAAEESLPTVPGRSAPRTIPVLEPRLEELQRGADGRLQRAVDPTVVAPDADPPAPDADPVDPGDGPSDPADPGDGVTGSETDPAAPEAGATGSGTGPTDPDADAGGEEVSGA